MMDIVSALASKEFIIAACSVAVNVALWRALQKEREDRIEDMRKGYEREQASLNMIRELKEVVSGFRQEFALWREMSDRLRQESRQ